MDNFSAHELGWRCVSERLQYTTIAWLPPNATSIHQPLDQGIIQNWKCYVRKSFVRFMASSFDKDEDPSKQMNVLRAVRWGIFAWEQEVLPATIYNCWIRSKAINHSGPECFTTNIFAESSAIITDIAQDVQRFHTQGRIQEMMSIHNFINPPEEIIDDVQEDITTEIIARYGEEKDAETDEEIEQQQIITVAEALQALEKLQRFEAQQASRQETFSKTLRTYEKNLQGIRSDALKQSTLNSWLD
jgi:hypothetical protein